MIQYLTDIKQRLSNAVYSRFRTKTRIGAYIEAIGTVLQTVESDTYGTTFSMLLSQATGETLNRWGTIVGEQRQGLSDERYRAVIRSKISAVAASGTAKKILDALASFTGDPNVEFRTSSSGWVRIAYTGDLGSDRHVRLLRTIEQGIAAGFGLEVIEMSSDPLRFGDSFGKSFGSKRIDS